MSRQNNNGKLELVISIITLLTAITNLLVVALPLLAELL